MQCQLIKLPAGCIWLSHTCFGTRKAECAFDHRKTRNLHNAQVSYAIYQAATEAAAPKGAAAGNSSPRGSRKRNAAGQAKAGDAGEARI